MGVKERFMPLEKVFHPKLPPITTSELKSPETFASHKKKVNRINTRVFGNKSPNDSFRASPVSNGSQNRSKRSVLSKK